MAKGNTGGVGQYRPPTSRTLTGSTSQPNANIGASRRSSGNTDLLGSITSILGNLGGGGDRNTTQPGGNVNANPYGNMLMGANPWNMGMMGGNPFTMFNPWSSGPSGAPPPPTNLMPRIETPPTPTPAPAPTPTRASSFDSGTASNKLRSKLTRDLSGDEIGMLKGALGLGSATDFTDSDIDRAVGLIRQHQPGILRG